MLPRRPSALELPRFRSFCFQMFFFISTMEWQYEMQRVLNSFKFPCLFGEKKNHIFSWNLSILRAAGRHGNIPTWSSWWRSQWNSPSCWVLSLLSPQQRPSFSKLFCASLKLLSTFSHLKSLNGTWTWEVGSRETPERSMCHLLWRKKKIKCPRCFDVCTAVGQMCFHVCRPEKDNQP